MQLERAANVLRIVLLEYNAFISAWYFYVISVYTMIMYEVHFLFILGQLFSYKINLDVKLVLLGKLHFKII